MKQGYPVKCLFHAGYPCIKIPHTKVCGVISHIPIDKTFLLSQNWNRNNRKTDIWRYKSEKTTLSVYDAVAASYASGLQSNDDTDA